MLGISKQTVSEWENGQGKPEINSVIKLTEIYDVSADYILLGIENRMSTSMLETRKMNKEYRKAIAIIAATAIITVLFIATLGLLLKLGI